MIQKQSINYLGRKAKDKISGSVGIIISVCFDLYGCIQVVLTPGKIAKDGKEVSSIGWIDINRIEIMKGKPVMKHPDFSNRYYSLEDVGGAANKPLK